jgi:MFS family permease
MSDDDPSTFEAAACQPRVEARRCTAKRRRSHRRTRRMARRAYRQTSRGSNQGSGTQLGPPSLLSVIAKAVGLDLIAVVPVGLAGTLGVLIAQDMDISPTLGALMVSGYFITGAAIALCTGSLSDRMGWRSGAVVGLLLILAGLIAPAVAKDTATLVGASVLAGGGAALVQPATSSLIAASASPHRGALAINIKLAAAPAALLLAGASVPALAQHVGWRITYLVAAVLPCLGLIALWHTRGSGSGPSITASCSTHTYRKLSVVTVCMFLGAMVPGSLIALMVPALVDVGYSAAAAGALFAALNALTIGSRVGIGLLGHRPAFGTFRSIAVMMLLAGLASALLLVQHPIVLLIGGALAFMIGFGWMGQAIAIAVRTVPGSPGAAAGLLQAGGMGGSAVGPLVGAALAERFGLSGAWLFAATTSIIGAAVLLCFAPIASGRAPAREKLSHPDAHGGTRDRPRASGARDN